MNPIEWLLVGASMELFFRPWMLVGDKLAVAASRVIAEGSRRGG